MYLVNTYSLVELSKRLHTIITRMGVVLPLRFIKHLRSIRIPLPTFFTHTGHGTILRRLYYLVYGNVPELDLSLIVFPLLIYEIFGKAHVPDLPSGTYITTDPHTYIYLRDCAGLHVEHGLERLLDHAQKVLEKVSVPRWRIVVFHPCQVRNDTVLSRIMTKVENLVDKVFQECVREFFTENSAICCGSVLWLTYPHLYLKVATRCLERLCRHGDVILTYCPFCYVNLRHIVDTVGIDWLRIVDIHEVLYWLLGVARDK